jgi:SAM-dependent methyltransferase
VRRLLGRDLPRLWNAAGVARRIGNGISFSAYNVSASSSISIAFMTTAISTQQRDAYDPFAMIYNRGIAEDFCRRAWPTVEKLLLSSISPKSRILDLCCGSGQMARELSNRGYDVVGLDGSSQMIELARENASNASFILADARRFSLAPKFNAVLCSFNSLAHANDIEELTSILRNAHAALKPGGLLLFDISLESAYSTKWRGSFGDAQSDAAWIVRPSYDPKTRLATNEVTVFKREGDWWQRSDFAITQRSFSESELRGALALADFIYVDAFEAEKDLNMGGEMGRKFFLCK